MSPENPPEVFVSYSHDSPEHRERVLGLTQRLRTDGIDAWVDRFEPWPEQGWPRWMEERIGSADFILLVCTAQYFRRLTGKDETGNGVIWEARQIYNELYERKDPGRYIPVLFDVGSSELIPRPLRGHTFFDVSDDEGYSNLVRRIREEPEVVPEPLGSPVPLELDAVPSSLKISSESRRKVFVSYTHRNPSEENLARFLVDGFNRASHEVFADLGLKAGEDWWLTIARRVDWCDCFVLLLSEHSASSEAVMGEVKRAGSRAREGKLRIFPVRVNYLDDLDWVIGHFVDHLHHLFFSSREDSQAILDELCVAIADPSSNISSTEITPYAAGTPRKGSQSKDPVPADTRESPRPLSEADPRVLFFDAKIPEHDPHYVMRREDSIVERRAANDKETLVLKAPRQFGKSSLLLRYLLDCKRRERKIWFVNLALYFTHDDLESYGSFLTGLARALLRSEGTRENVTIRNQIDMNEFVEERLRADQNSPVVLALDDVDRLYGRKYAEDFYTMLRGWHERIERPFHAFSLALSISTDPSLLITSPYRSPFNVTDPLRLSPFGEDGCAELNRSHHGVLAEQNIPRIHDLLGGHPYLTRLSLYRMREEGMSFDDLDEMADHDRGPFGDHLRALLGLLTDGQLLDPLRKFMRTRRTPARDMVHRLEAAGLVRRDGKKVVPANLLYARYFKNV